MKKCFVILLIVLIGLLVPLSLNSCHKPVTRQAGTVNTSPTSPITPPPEGMVLIPAGEFQMGSNDKEAQSNEKPVRTVYNETEWMPDNHLRWAVRRTLKLAPDAPLTPQVLEGLTELQADRQRIRSLKGLAYATGLKVLNLSENQAIDITPLANLMGLQELYLSGSDISDLTPLANLTGLKVLHLSRNKIIDITPLANLTGLKKLYLKGNEISDLTFLAVLTGLQELDLSHNEISDPTPLANLTGLQVLDLSYNDIRDLMLLTDLTRLKVLNLANNDSQRSHTISKLDGIEGVISQ